MYFRENNSFLAVTVLLRSSLLGINVTLLGTLSFSGCVGSGPHTLSRKQCEILQRGTKKEIKMPLRLTQKSPLEALGFFFSF